MTLAANPQDRQLALSITEEAISRSEQHADADWMETAYHAGIAAARIHPTLTSDQVWLGLTDEHGIEWQPHEPSAMGPVMRRLARDGYIRRISGAFRHSLRASAHMKPLPVYESLIYGGHR